MENLELNNDIDNDSINSTELFRKNKEYDDDSHYVSDTLFNNLTINARKNGANIIRGGAEAEKHLDMAEASASIIGDTIIFREKATISDILEETYHFIQNKTGMNDDKEEPLRSILNEIDAKKYLLDNAAKYNIPRKEVEKTKHQLESYEVQLKTLEALL